MSRTGPVLDTTAVLLDQRLAREQSTAQLPSVVAAVVRGGEPVWTGAHGRHTQREPGSTDPRTQYRIGSITKTMTAVLVMQLRDEGRLDLADPLSAHLPGVGLGEASIRSLLTHSAGLPAEPPGPWWERSPGRSWDTLSAEVAGLSAALPPGRQHHYSNLGYALLGRLVGQLRGCEWYEALSRHLLQPLGLTRTSYAAAQPAAQGFSVHPYAETLVDEPAQDTASMAPAGQLWSTATDLVRWLGFLAEPAASVLAPDALEEMVILSSAEPGGALRDAYGLGLRLLRRGERVLVGHTGSMPGFIATAFVDRRSGVGAVALANATRGLDADGLPAELVALVLDHEPTSPPAWAPNESAGDAADLLGQWYWGNSPLALRLRGDVLTMGSGRGATRFRRAGSDEYVGLDGYFTGEALRVVRRPDGDISHLDLATFVLTRTPYDPGAPIPGGVPQR